MRSCASTLTRVEAAELAVGSAGEGVAEVDLQRRLDERQVDVSWPDLMRDLGEVRAVDLTLDGKRYRLRTDLRGSAHHAFAAAAVGPPAVVAPLGPQASESPPSPAASGVEVPA